MMWKWMVMVFAALAAAGGTGTLQLRCLPPEYFAERDLTGAEPVQIGRAPDGRLQLDFNNGCRVATDAATGELTAYAPDGTVLLFQPAQRPLFGLTELKDGRPGVVAYQTRLVEVWQNGSTALLHYEWTAPDGKNGTVNWIFEPASQEINGKRFDGLADRFEIAVPGRLLHQLELYGITAWGNGEIPGARSFRLACYTSEHGYLEAVFDGKAQNLGTWGSTIDGGQFFHVLGLKNGTLYEYFDDELHDQTTMEFQNVFGGVDLRHQLTLGRVPGYYMTPRRYRLMTATPLSEGLWMELNQSRHRYFQERYDIPAGTLRPAVFIRNFWYTEGFERPIAEWLPQFEEFGFKRCEIGWINERGINPKHPEAWPGDHVLAPDGSYVTWRNHQDELKNALMSEHGGVPALRRFTDAAHERGIEVYAWHQTAHGWRGDPLLRNHPDWAVYTLDGDFFSGSYPGVLAWYDLGSDFLAYTLEEVRKTKEAVGLDGVWLDMYGTGVFGSVNYAKPVAFPGMASRREFTRRLRAMGLGVYGEGIAPYVMESFEIQPNANWRGHEFILTGTAPFDWRLMQDPNQGLDFFKLLSYQCFPTDTGWFLNPPPEAVTRVAELRYRNEVFNRIEAELGATPIGVVRNAIGTQWVMADGNVFFCHDGATVEIAVAGTPTVTAIAPDGATFATELVGGVLHTTLPPRGVLIVKNE